MTIDIENSKLEHDPDRTMLLLVDNGSEGWHCVARATTTEELTSCLNRIHGSAWLVVQSHSCVLVRT